MIPSGASGDNKGYKPDVKRDYTREDVERLSGSVRIEHTLARLGAARLRQLLAERPFVRTLGAMTGAQAMQQVKGGSRPFTCRAGRSRRTPTTRVRCIPTSRSIRRRPCPRW